MKMITPTATQALTGSLCLGVALSSMACGSSGPAEGEHAYFLTLVGDRNVYLDNGEQTELQVRYHDADDQPLSGVVDFDIDGQARGAELRSDSASTNSNGVASVTLDASTDEQSSFYIEASAPDAGTATWNVTIEEPQEPLDPAGVYEVESSYDLVTGLEEGTVREVVHGVLDFSEDPGGYVVQLLVEQCNVSFCDFLEENASIIGTVLNQALEQNAPELVSDILQIGEDFGEVVRNFGVKSELRIDGNTGLLSADHELTGVVVAYGNEERYFTMSNMGVDNVEAQTVSFAMEEDESEVTLGEHAMPFSYGAMLKVAINQIVRNLDDNADDLGSFLTNRIPCDDVGEFIEENLPFDLPDFLDGETLCQIAIEEGSNLLMNQIESIDDTGLELVVSGKARPVSTNGDEKPDVLRDGTWEGKLEYAGTLGATLEAEDNEFTAERIGD